MHSNPDKLQPFWGWAAKNPLATGAYCSSSGAPHGQPAINQSTHLITAAAIRRTCSISRWCGCALTGSCLDDEGLRLAGPPCPCPLGGRLQGGGLQGEPCVVVRAPQAIFPLSTKGDLSATCAVAALLGLRVLHAAEGEQRGGLCGAAQQRGSKRQPDQRPGPA